MTFRPRTEHEGCVEADPIHLELSYGDLSDIIMALTEDLRRDMQLFAEATVARLMKDEQDPEEQMLIDRLGDVIRGKKQKIAQYREVAKLHWQSLPADRRRIEEEFHAWTKEDTAEEDGAESSSQAPDVG